MAAEKEIWGMSVSDSRQISLLILDELKQIN